MEPIGVLTANPAGSPRVTQTVQGMPVSVGLIRQPSDDVLAKHNPEGNVRKPAGSGA